MKNKCKYKEKVMDTQYKYRCAWGLKNHESFPNAYKNVEGVIDFIYLNKGECKGCKCKEIEHKEKGLI